MEGHLAARSRNPPLTVVEARRMFTVHVTLNSATAHVRVGVAAYRCPDGLRLFCRHFAYWPIIPRPVTFLLRHGSCSPDDDTEVQGRRRGERAQFATPFSSIKKAKALQKHSHGTRLTHQWQEMEHMPTTPKGQLVKGTLQSSQSNERQ